MRSAECWRQNLWRDSVWPYPESSETCLPKLYLESSSPKNLLLNGTSVVSWEPTDGPYAGTFQEPANLPKTHQAARAMVAMKCQKDMYVKHFCKDIGFLKCSTNQQAYCSRRHCDLQSPCVAFPASHTSLGVWPDRKKCMPNAPAIQSCPLPEWNLTVNNHIVKLFCENLVCWNQVSLEFSLWPPSTKDLCNKSCIRFG